MPKNNQQVEIGKSCMICGEQAYSVLFEARDFDTGTKQFILQECNKCRSVRTFPVLSEDQIAGYYSCDYYGAGQEKFSGIMERITRYSNYRLAKSINRCFHSLNDKKDTDIRVLDVGCGRANLLKEMRKLGYDCHGVERGNFPVDLRAEGIHFYKGGLEQVKSGGGCFDIIILWHVLEHLYDPGTTLDNVVQLLDPGGLLILAVPNFLSYQAKCFGPYWFHLDLPRHLHHFGLKDLRKHLELIGLHTVYQSTFSPDQNIYGFMQSVLNRIFSRQRPNSLYSLLKKTGNKRPLFQLFIWLIPACVVFPIALVEYLLSGLVGRGATAILYAEKR